GQASKQQEEPELEQAAKEPAHRAKPPAAVGDGAWRSRRCGLLAISLAGARLCGHVAVCPACVVGPAPGDAGEDADEQKQQDGPQEKSSSKEHGRQLLVSSSRPLSAMTSILADSIDDECVKVMNGLRKGCEWPPDAAFRPIAPGRRNSAINRSVDAVAARRLTA